MAGFVPATLDMRVQYSIPCTTDVMSVNDAREKLNKAIR
jgi:hypothetical protein